jgi:hypothetical protein
LGPFFGKAAPPETLISRLASFLEKKAEAKNLVLVFLEANPVLRRPLRCNKRDYDLTMTNS